MMVKLNLTTWERLTLKVIIESIPGRLPIGHVRAGFSLVDILEFSPEEEKQAGVVKLPSGASRFPDVSLDWSLELPKGAVRKILPIVFETGFEMNRRGLALADKLQQILDELKQEA